MFSKLFAIRYSPFANSRQQTANSEKLSVAQTGQTLMELLVVTSVSVMIIGALVFATISSLRNAQFAKNQVQATKLAQEGIEKVRSSRDRNGRITITGSSVTSWNGDEDRTGSIWDYPIYNGCGSGVTGTSCYLKFISPNSGDLTWISSSTSFPDSGAEDPYGNRLFMRAIILSDDTATSTSQKTVTVIVKWTDFSGFHESRLTTILRNISE